MAFTKKTFIAGKDQAGAFKSTHLHGHWKLDRAIAKARGMGFTGEFNVEHTVFDNSGKGRGGHDGRWLVSAEGVAEKTQAWREGRTVQAFAQ